MEQKKVIIRYVGAGDRISVFDFRMNNSYHTPTRQFPQSYTSFIYLHTPHISHTIHTIHNLYSLAQMLSILDDMKWKLSYVDFLKVMHNLPARFSLSLEWPMVIFIGHKFRLFFLFIMLFFLQIILILCKLLENIVEEEGMRRKLSDENKMDIVKDYGNLVPIIELARKYKVSRQAIWKMLRKAEVKTSKRKIKVLCSVCGKEIYRGKARIRNQKNHFCSWECWKAFLEAGNGFPYIQNRNGQKIARAIVSEYFKLESGNIVHHENRDDLDNRPENLKVFCNQGDHIKYHRGFDIEPIWEGGNHG